jgi:hypothetical protein
MNLQVGEYYFWGEGFGSYYHHHIDYLVRLCEVLYDSDGKPDEVVFKVLHQGFSPEYGLLKDIDARVVGELCKEKIPSEKLEHLHYFIPIDLEERNNLKNEDYEEIIKIIRYDRLRFLRRQLTQIIERNETKTGAAKNSWIDISAIVEQLNELKFPMEISDFLFLSEFNNRFEFSESKDKIRLKP